MRYLFTTTPGFSHATPMIPLAYGARLAGHQVLFAASGRALKAAVAAGLPAVDAAPGRDVTKPYINLTTMAVETELSVEETMKQVFAAFGEMSDLMLDGLVDTAREWKADAILYPPMLPAGLLAARAVGAKAVLHGIGLRHPAFPWPMESLAPAAQRCGVTVLPHQPDVELGLAPDSLESVSPTAPEGASPYPVLSMRPCPYNGGGQIPEWVLSSPGRPRIVATMGSVAAHNGQTELLTAIVEATADMDVELVLTAGGTDLEALLGPLPAHVRSADFLPLSALLPSCDAVVHHGGMGTMFAALAAGTPQVSLPTTNGDAQTNAVVTERRGAGITIQPGDVTAQSVGKAIRDVLMVPGYREASGAVGAEMLTMPDPLDVANRLASLIA